MRWRKIVIDDHEYTYAIGTTYVVAKREDGGVIARERVWNVKGMDATTYYRDLERSVGQAAVTPSDIERWLRGQI